MTKHEDGHILHFEMHQTLEAAATELAYIAVSVRGALIESN